eukprot:CAMPEP_0181360792 /NCGR_PEP_ID=MMETSP1106-20121128/6880_1 /TAXON_ID=81844 /ORGANISM="Mantoniella antarctica, Strain SL-175" /LENGTH=110 /DNA_ID=CAMNT_0023474139 /DNA_START=244 /DNA_END=577 /DNA_ORIENTATION=-
MQKRVVAREALDAKASATAATRRRAAASARGAMMEGGSGVMFTPVPPWNFSSKERISPHATTVRLGSSAVIVPLRPTTPTVTSTQREPRDDTDADASAGVDGQGDGGDDV